MKHLILVVLLILSFSSYAGKYNMQLTFVDGYTNEVIANERVTVRITNLDWKKEFTTNSKGEIDFKFKAKHFIKYSFDFACGKYEFQVRERYLREDKNIKITFKLYPSEEYEKMIKADEEKKLSLLTEAPDSVQCFSTTNEVSNFLEESIINKYLQLPYWYGDYGFKVEFLVQATFNPTGKPLQVEIVESSDHHLNQEIIRLVRLIPERKTPICDKQYKRTLQFPVVIDHDLGM
ncbi:MAG: hypothetical protein HWE22_05105 [Flavobacteriales bacterium]|nr:hypothetical protein [Flavobacteriales bacterium]